ncbi:hypothetical protein DMC30DRAFT_288693 [Rhodotorula diobovata]|uniref:Uncharacterized protein n=1 Tax=Rhodotorula diobovata TaxID=5288 RepID=A0A5C5FSI2_9BASI|nr:hypothetical protein DMC30DRAFT_288693 [Rhodotorula diobovata]
MSLIAQYSLVGVRDLDPPNDLGSGLMRAFELVKAQVPADPEGRWQRSYILDTRVALKEWKDHMTNVLLEQWMSSSLANRVHFAKAMMWWNDQMQAARSLTAARMVRSLSRDSSYPQTDCQDCSHHSGSCEDGWRARPWSTGGTRSSGPGFRMTRSRRRRSPKPLLLLKSAIARPSGTAWTRQSGRGARTGGDSSASLSSSPTCHAGPVSALRTVPVLVSRQTRSLVLSLPQLALLSVPRGASSTGSSSPRAFYAF